MKKALFYTFAAGMAVMSSLTASAQNEGGGAAVERCTSVTKTPEANAPAKVPLLYDYSSALTEYANSGAQQAIVTDNVNYFYTGSADPDNTGDKHVFHKYDYKWSAEGFDIAGVPGVRALTFDGTYFYGVWLDEIYKMDFDNKTLLKTFRAPASLRYCAYDPDADGFWMGNDSYLYFMYSSGEFTEINVRKLPSAYGCVYVKGGFDNKGHLLLSCPGGRGKSEIYDYDIDKNIVTGPLFDVAEIAGIEGVSGGGRDLTVYDYYGTNVLVANVDRGSKTNAVVHVFLSDIQWPSTVVSDEVMPLPFVESFENSSPTIRYWYGIDADGDGRNWLLNYCEDWTGDGSSGPGYVRTGYGMALSQSYKSGVGGLTPDNWLVSPIIEEGSHRSLRFGVRATSAGYDDKLAVYVIDGSENVDRFIESPRNKLRETIIYWAEWSDFTFDLAEYRGPIRIALRHFDSRDQYAIAIDDLEVTGTKTNGIEEVDAGGREADSRMYDVAGRRISNPAKGQLYIKGGKKYIAR